MTVPWRRAANCCSGVVARFSSFRRSMPGTPSLPSDSATVTDADLLRRWRRGSLIDDSALRSPASPAPKFQGTDERDVNRHQRRLLQWRRRDQQRLRGRDGDDSSKRHQREDRRREPTGTKSGGGRIVDRRNDGNGADGFHPQPEMALPSAAERWRGIALIGGRRSCRSLRSPATPPARPAVGVVGASSATGRRSTRSNSIVASNTGDDCLRTTGTFTSLGYNLEDSPDMCEFTSRPTRSWPLRPRPRAGSANNGGPTMTTLRPALGASDQTRHPIPADWHRRVLPTPQPVTMDQRGVNLLAAGGRQLATSAHTVRRCRLGVDPPLPVPLKPFDGSTNDDHVAGRYAGLVLRDEHDCYMERCWPG